MKCNGAARNLNTLNSLDTQTHNAKNPQQNWLNINMPHKFNKKYAFKVDLQIIAYKKISINYVDFKTSLIHKRFLF